MIGRFQSTNSTMAANTSYAMAEYSAFLRQTWNFYLITVPGYYRSLNESQHGIVEQIWLETIHICSPNIHFALHLFALLTTTLAIAFTRRFLYHIIQRMAANTGLLEKFDMNRFTESLVNCLFYSSSFSLAFHYVHTNQLLTHPDRVWIDYSPTNTVPLIVRVLYTMEISYYLYMLYAVYAVNDRKKDSHILFIHHIVAIVLMAYSYLIRAHGIGVLVLYLHDICDIFMEGCKCLIRLKVTNWWMVQLLVVLRFLGYALFVSLWFIFRLYYFPLTVLHPLILRVPLANAFGSFIFFYTFLVLLFAMNLYWATLIIRVGLNSIHGGHKEIDDIREVPQPKPHHD